MDVTPTTPTAKAASASQSGKSGQGVISSDFETFLKMLTTQMENQDPLNPMESSDFAVQLATFSGVEQQVLSNDLLKNLGSQMGVMNLSQLSGWVGMEARVNAPVSFSGDPVELYPEIPPLADQATLVVKDSYGREVNREPLTLGATEHSWTGRDRAGARLPNGTYSFEVQAQKGSAALDPTPVYSYAKVEEVRSNNGATELILPGNQTVSSSDVTALRQPN